MLLNALAHADHYGRQGIVIIKSDNQLTLSNPGDIRIGLRLALQGGVSDPRNETIMKMFSLVDIGERAGSGIPEAINVWERYIKLHPEYKVTDNPSRTSILLPYTIKALQEAGKRIVEEMNAATTQNIDNTTQNADNTTQKPEGTTQITTQNTDKTTQNLSAVQQKILGLLRENPKISRNEITAKIDSISEDGVKYHLGRLQKMGVIRREGPDHGGKWVVN